MPGKRSRLSSEDSLIQLFKNRYPAKSTLIKKGIGDDAAVFRPKEAAEFWLITSDMLVEAIDFRREWMTPRMLGRKSLSVNLSDLAAMGARPRFFTVSLAVTPDISERWMVEFHDGLSERAVPQGAHLIGGDLSSSERHIAISITAIGESLNRKVLYRSGGNAGDFLYVTGTLGRSAAGLRLLQEGDTKSRLHSRREALHAHQDPEPRCDAGLWLAQSGLVSCMMDLSDGLSVDLPRLCAASGVGAEIRLPDLPVFHQCSLWDCNPVELALHGGEDYELLFAVSSSRSHLLEKTYPSKLPPITKIGELTADVGKVLLVGPDPDTTRKLLPRSGWDHFKNK